MGAAIETVIQSIAGVALVLLILFFCFRSQLIRLCALIREKDHQIAQVERWQAEKKQREQEQNDQSRKIAEATVDEFLQGTSHESQKENVKNGERHL